ncbi:hypothetical protein [Salinispira pacifica]
MNWFEMRYFAAERQRELLSTARNIRIAADLRRRRFPMHRNRRFGGILRQLLRRISGPIEADMERREDEHCLPATWRPLAQGCRDR